MNHDKIPTSKEKIPAIQQPVRMKPIKIPVQTQLEMDDPSENPGGHLGARDEQVDHSLTPPDPEESVEKVSR